MCCVFSFGLVFSSGYHFTINLHSSILGVALRILVAQWNEIGLLCSFQILLTQNFNNCCSLFYVFVSEIIWGTLRGVQQGVATLRYVSELWRGAVF